MANRTQRARKPESEKSRVYHARLHPDTDLWAMQLIAEYAKSGIHFRELTLMGLSALEGKPLQSSEIPVKTQDVSHIKETLQFLVELIQSGDFSAGKKPKKRIVDTLRELPKEVSETLKHYLGGGAVFDDE